MELTDDVPLKYTVSRRDIYTTAKKAEVSMGEEGASCADDGADLVEYCVTTQSGGTTG